MHNILVSIVVIMHNIGEIFFSFWQKRQNFIIH